MELIRGGLHRGITIRIRNSEFFAFAFACTVELSTPRVQTQTEVRGDNGKVEFGIFALYIFIDYVSMSLKLMYFNPRSRAQWYRRCIHPLRPSATLKTDGLTAPMYAYGAWPEQQIPDGTCT